MGKFYNLEELMNNQKIYINKINTPNNEEINLLFSKV